MIAQDNATEGVADGEPTNLSIRRSRTFGYFDDDSSH